MRLSGALPVLAALQVLGAAVPSSAPAPLLLEGGDADDRAFARLAAGLGPGGLAPEALPMALEAIRATDRFRSVTGTSQRIALDPWPVLRTIRWEGDVPKGFRKELFPGVHSGDRVGNLRLELLRARAQDLLAGSGYPQARVRFARGDLDRELTITVDPGPADRVREVEFRGHLGPFGRSGLMHAAGIVPGTSLWCRSFELDCIQGLRKKLRDGKRFEGQVDLAWDGLGKVTVHVEAGPRVILRHEGGGLHWWRISEPGLEDMVPLARAEKYTPDLLDEGERRIVRYFRSQGYLEPQVSHRREVAEQGPDGPEKVVVTYRVVPGTRTRVNLLRFEGNQAISTRELRRAAGLPGEGLANLKARPEVLDSVEDKVTALYQARGYTEATVHRRLEKEKEGTALVLRIREGQRQMMSWLRLELPLGGLGDPWGLGECLPLLYSDKAVLENGTATTRRYRSDRPEFKGVGAVLSQEERDGRLRMTLAFSSPVPLTKVDLFRVYTAIRQAHLVSMGVLRPVVRVQVAQEETLGVRFEIPDQAAERVERVVVQGCDRTRAKAVEREIPFRPGDPLDLEKVSRAQGNLGALGAFGRTDFQGLGEVQGLPGPPQPWKPGDLLLSTEERNPWSFSHAFGYDRTQGYYFGTGVERQNVGGMGRVVDFDVRAGDGFIHNPTLHDIFKTGDYTESLNSISLAYTDPWFQPGILDGVLPDRTAFRTEGAYIQEERYVYSIHRRRFITSLRWRLPANMSVEAGYRLEREDVASNEGVDLSEEELENTARYLPHAVISAPYVQLVRDTRDNAFDPTNGMYSLARFEAALQAFGTSDNSSFLKLDVRNQWTWPVGFKAGAGVVSLGLRVAAARPTASTSQFIPLAERFFAGGSGSHRGVDPYFLGDVTTIPIWNVSSGKAVQDGSVLIPLGGQALALLNLEYRFPIYGQMVWGEAFCDSGQVYQALQTFTVPDYLTGQTTVRATFPPLRTAVGLGLIFKIGIPVKVEYGVDVRTLMQETLPPQDEETHLHHLLVSAGFQF
jgi:outer membrane protein assembly factor BamA